MIDDKTFQFQVYVTGGGILVPRICAVRQGRQSPCHDHGLSDRFPRSSCFGVHMSPAQSSETPKQPDAQRSQMSGAADGAHETRETREIDPEMRRGIAELGFMAMRCFGEKDKNFVASPLSAFAALCMCPPLFTGETRRELERPLGLSAGESNERFFQRVRTLLDRVEDSSLSLYCRVVANISVPYEEGTFDVFRDVLRAPAVVAGFPEPATELLNKEIEKVTGECLMEGEDDESALGLCIPPISSLPEDATIVLVNVASFSGLWRLESHCHDLVWHRNGEEKLVPAFTIFTESTYYREADGFTFASLEYYVKGQELLFVLPPADRPFDPSMLSVEFFLANIPQEKRIVEMTVPSWEIKDLDVSLQSVSEGLGIHRIFSDSADTVGCAPYHVGGFHQNVSIRVNSAGTWACAITLLEMFGGVEADPLPMVRFRADRPFFYAIYDRTHDVIEFLGYLVEPEYGPGRLTGRTYAEPCLDPLCG